MTHNQNVTTQAASQSRQFGRVQVECLLCFVRCSWISRHRRCIAGMTITQLLEEKFYNAKYLRTKRQRLWQAIKQRND